jgi:glycine cleavage system aminomethyltransferase T
MTNERGGIIDDTVITKACSSLSSARAWLAVRERQRCTALRCATVLV